MDSRTNWMNRLNVIRELSSPGRKGFENRAEIREVVEVVIRESYSNQNYNESLTHNLTRILRNFPYLLEILVLFLIQNIWTHNKSVVTSKEILAHLMKKRDECSRIFMRSIRNETRKREVLSMFDFLKEFDLYDEDYQKLRRTIILKIWLKVNDNMEMSSSTEQTDQTLNYNKFFALLSMMCNENLIAKNAILIIFRPEMIENLDSEGTILLRFLEMINIEEFSQILDNLRMFVPESLMNKVLIEYFRNEKNSRDKKMFMQKMKLFASRNSGVYHTDVMLTEQLLQRIEILEADDEILRDGYAMSLVRSGNSSNHPHWTNDRATIVPILEYALKYLPKDCNNCEVKMRMVEVVITLVNSFVDMRLTPVASSENDLKTDYLRRLTELQPILQEFRKYFGTGDRRYKLISKIIVKIDKILSSPTRRATLRGCVTLECRIFDEHMVNVYKNFHFLMKRDKGVFMA